jgi:hypothetical protein
VLKVKRVSSHTAEIELNLKGETLEIMVLLEALVQTEIQECLEHQVFQVKKVK